MKKMYMLGLAFVLIASLLAACGGNGDDQAEGGTETKPEGQTEEKVTLKMFQFKVEIAEDLAEMEKEFEAEYPNIDLVIETVGGGADYGAALKAKFASGEEPDVFNNGGFVEAALWQDKLADLTNEPWAANVVPLGKLPMTIDGKLYGMPVNLEGYGFIYNKDLFTQAGITEKPTNLAELQAAAEKLKAAGITPFSAGYAEWWVIGQHLLNLGFAHQPDPDAFIEGLNAGTEKFAGNPTFQDFKNLFDTEIKYANDNPLTTDYNTQVTLFASGQAAMMQQGNWTENMIYEINPDMNMGFLAIPLTNDSASQDKLPVGVPNNWVINKNSAHIEEAKTLLNWMVSSDTGKRYLTEEFAFIPAFDNIEPTGLGALGKDILEYSKQDKTVPWTWFKWPDGANKEFAAAMQEYSVGKITYDELLNRFQQTWDNLKK
jgi:raffinose/stachyose/melibiose transport system substrate-binding protein